MACRLERGSHAADGAKLISTGPVIYGYDGIGTITQNDACTSVGQLVRSFTYLLQAARVLQLDQFAQVTLLLMVN